MAYSTLDSIRTVSLNPDLGLDSDSDNRYGDTTVRNNALRDAFARLWPNMARLIRETVTIADDTVDYTLTAIRDLLTLEVLDDQGVVFDENRNWRVWTDASADPVVLRLLLAAPYSGFTGSVRAIGYAPYIVPATGAATCDLEPRMEWIVVAGARANLYRRQLSQWMTFERRLNDNPTTSVGPAELMTMYREAESQFAAAIRDHGRPLTLPKTTRVRR